MLVTKAKCKSQCPIVLRPPKQKPKESAEAEFVPSAAIFAILLLAEVLSSYSLCFLVFSSMSIKRLIVSAAPNKLIKINTPIIKEAIE